MKNTQVTPKDTAKGTSRNRTSSGRLVVRAKGAFMKGHARLVRSVLGAAVIVAAAWPAHAQTGSLDPVSNAAFKSLFSTTYSAGADQTPTQQSPKHEGVGIGIKIGPLFNKFTSDIVTLNFQGKTGLMGGIFFGGNRTGVVGVMGELMYAKKSTTTAEGDLDLYYLEIPILLRINIGSNSLNGVLVYGLAGPVFDINLKSKLNGVEVGSRFSDFDTGIILGGGIEITRFIIEGRYNWGLLNILEIKLASASNVKTQSFALLFGVRFN